MFSVTKNTIDDDLSNFTKNVFQIKEDEDDEVAIEIELKELLNENDKISIRLSYDGTIFSEMTLRWREND